MSSLYPIRAKRDPYRGRDPRKMRKRQEYNEQAERIERYVNEEFAKSGESQQTFYYGSIAVALGIPEAVIADALFSVSGGHNACSVRRDDRDPIAGPS